MERLRPPCALSALHRRRPPRFLRSDRRARGADLARALDLAASHHRLRGAGGASTISSGTSAGRGSIEPPGRPHCWRRLLRFHLANGLISIAGNAALMALLVGVLGLPPVPANALAVAAMSVLNFLLADRWVFRGDRSYHGGREIESTASRVRLPSVSSAVISLAAMLAMSITLLQRRAAPLGRTISRRPSPRGSATWRRPKSASNDPAPRAYRARRTRLPPPARASTCRPGRSATGAARSSSRTSRSTGCFTACSIPAPRRRRKTSSRRA